MCQPKAVVFTHFGGLKYRYKHHSQSIKLDLALYDQKKEEYKDILSRYFKCNDHGEIISLVYVYVDWGITTARLNEFKKKRTVVVDGDLLFEERVLIELLKNAERDVRRDLKITRDAPPHFHFVGISELIALLNDLVDIDPDLVDYLAGENNTFTYDSPKFIEAVIRLARGSTAHLAWHPIIRLDEDVIPYPESITALLNAYVQRAQRSPVFFFSGTYGEPGGLYDPINDHAVRVHWFGKEDPQGFFIPNEPVIKPFLADLNELGATQIQNSNEHYSNNLIEKLKNRQSNYPSRTSRQVISGAGLIMSFRAIDLLPPFMNVGDYIVWVDDHLKRRLHEALDDISVYELECIEAAKFKQCRYPYQKRCDGIRKGDIQWAKTTYFDRLLRGCIFRRLLTNLDGTATEYSSLIKNIVEYRERRKGWEEKDKSSLVEIMGKQAQERYDEVLTCWASGEFEGYASYDWAQEKRNDPIHENEICTRVVEDALCYVDLVLAWPIFVRAIKKLPFVGHDWLFEEIEDSLPGPATLISPPVIPRPDPVIPRPDIDLFISYSSRFKDQAEEIQQKAKQKLLNVFLDKTDISYGSDFSEVIKESLLRSRELCVLVTPDAITSEWIISEWGAAWALNKRITPILHRCDVGQLPDRLKRFEVVDLIDIDRYLDQVKERKE
jgi:hypothetical protein